jgi:nicotinamide-nucleotide amidase
MQFDTLAEIITIGDEILYGQITDTNTQWISAELDKIGIKTIRKTSIGDDEGQILTALAEAQQRADVVLITGGLGPTKDDITKKTFCKYFNTHLVVHPQALTDVTEFFAKRGRTLTDINRGQGELPANAVFVRNTRGTAPGMWFDEANTIFVSMPGVPFEMKGLMTDEVLPKLKEHFKTPFIFHRIIKTVGIGESYLAEMIEKWEDALPSNMKLAYLPSMGQVKLRLTGWGDDEAGITSAVLAKIEEVLPIIAEFVFGFDSDELEIVIGNRLKERKETIAVAESCTGGYLEHLFTKVAGCSDYFMGGIVAYSYDIKERFLDIPAQVLNTHGAVSEETIRLMAENIKTKMGTTYGLATSGIAGPGGGTPDKPVGTIWIGLATPQQTKALRLQLGGSREQNIHLTATALINLLRKEIFEIK